jgi:uncharacterized protein YpiB (UPF0302 family)
MAGEKKSESVRTDERPEELTKAELLQLVDEALARRREHRKRFFVALEQLDRLARSR